MMPLSARDEWRIEMEKKYALICKPCGRKIMDPDKGTANQIFSKSVCTVCQESQIIPNINDLYPFTLAMVGF